jgi:outer membrane protein assembly factor BamB
MRRKAPFFAAVIRAAFMCATALGAVAPSALRMSAAELAAGRDWPQWRGDALDGRSPEKAVPTTWSGTENVAWKTAIPGKGHSSPVISEGRVFVTTAIEETGDRVLLCLDRKDGKILWQKTVVTSTLEKKHRLNSFSSSTPAADGKHVYVSFFKAPQIVLAAYDYDGNEVWRTSPGTFSSVHGFCSSPILYNDLLILNGDQDAPAFLVGINKHTGKEVWRTDRPNKTRSYCTPIIVELAGKPQMVLAGSKCVASYDPTTGKQHWIIDGPTEQMVASLVTTNGILFCTGGFPELHVLAIDPAGSGNVSKTHVLWRDGQSKGDRKIASYVPSPIAYGDWFYVVSDNGLLSCYDAKTGEAKYRQKLGKHHSASAVADGNGHLFFTSDAGETFVVKAGADYKEVVKNELGEEVYASPAISKGQLFIRGAKHLYCIGK